MKIKHFSECILYELTDMYEVFYIILTAHLWPCWYFYPHFTKKEGWSLEMLSKLVKGTWLSNGWVKSQTQEIYIYHNPPSIPGSQPTASFSQTVNCLSDLALCSTIKQIAILQKADSSLLVPTVSPAVRSTALLTCGCGVESPRELPFWRLVSTLRVWCNGCRLSLRSFSLPGHLHEMVLGSPPLSFLTTQWNPVGLGLNGWYLASELSKKFEFGKDEKVLMIMMITSYHLLNIAQCSSFTDIYIYY